MDVEGKNKQLEEQNARLFKEKERLAALYSDEQDTCQSAQDEVSRLNTAKNNLEKQIKELERKILFTDQQGTDLSGLKKKLEAEHAELKRNLQDVTYRLGKAENEVKTRDAQLNKLKTDLAAQQEANIKLKQEKKSSQENADQAYQLEAEIKKLNRANKELMDQLNQTNSKVADASREANSLTSACLSLESKINALLRQKEEVDAASNNYLAKLQKAQAEVKEANARANAAETLAQEIRAERRAH